MKNSYEIYINRRPYIVPYKTFICHCTGQFKSLQPSNTYSEFLRDYIIPRDDLIPLCRTILSSNNPNPYAEINEKTLYSSLIIRELKQSLLLTTWFSIYFNTLSPKENTTLTEVIDAGINYPKMPLSNDYLSLYPLTTFYKRLICIDIDWDRYEFPLYLKDYVSIEDIRRCLEEYNYGVTYEDIEQDIEKHLILAKYDNYYIWSCNLIYKWLLDVDHSDLYRIGLNKILSVEHN